jgi:hypothetical protein
LYSYFFEENGIRLQLRTTKQTRGTTMAKVQRKTIEVFIAKDGKEFKTLKEAEEQNNEILVTSLLDHCYEYTDIHYPETNTCAEDSLENILILLLKNNVTTRKKIQELLETIDEQKG